VGVGVGVGVGIGAGTSLSPPPPQAVSVKTANNRPQSLVSSFFIIIKQKTRGGPILARPHCILT